jgi:hypothetical protein
LKSIDSSLNKDDGKSNLFDVEILNNFQVNQQNVWLLFLPNFLMETPFHYLLDNSELPIFYKISNDISDDMFEQFLNSEYLEKIKNMFIFILENKYCYPLYSIKYNYSTLYFENEDYDEDDDNGDENIEKINNYLDKINEKLCESFKQRNDFIIDFTTQFKVSKNILIAE